MVHSAYSDQLIQRDDFSSVKRESLQIGPDITDELGILHRTSIKNIEFGKKVAETQIGKGQSQRTIEDNLGSASLKSPKTTIWFDNIDGFDFCFIFRFQCLVVFPCQFSGTWQQFVTNFFDVISLILGSIILVCTR